VILITVIGKLTHGGNAPAPPPPGTLRLSREQLAAMPTVRVGAGGVGRPDHGDGRDQVDATRSTPC
jgi:cobalt-zinc-cadmium efflux system membrane fusion protein